MATWLELRRDGVRLAVCDFGGHGPAVLLIHGLAGYAGEWAPTASWLADRARVVAVDVRGHGRSERRPRDVSAEAVADDVAWVIRTLGLAPVVIVGQSLGGVYAMCVAAWHPDLVAGVVVIEAGPSGGDEADAHARTVADALRAWPAKFASRTEAVRYFAAKFGGEGVGEIWADGLEERDDGLHPRFDPHVMEAMLRAAVREDRWMLWRSLDAPRLVLRGSAGSLDAASADAMGRAGPDVRVVTLEGAGHDAHLDRPEAWRAALSAFLDELPSPS